MPLNITLKQIERFFLSRRVAVVLLVATLSILVFSTRFGRITTITTSLYFLVLPLLIFASIFFCTLNRVRTRSARVPAVSAFQVKRVIDLGPQHDITDVAEHLSRRWTLVEKVEGGSLVLTTGKEGFWGSMLFHAGLLLMLIAATLTAVTLFSAELLLTQGLPLPLGREGFLKIWREPLIAPAFPDGEIALDEFKAVFKDERFPVDYVARVRVSDDSGERSADVRVNDPLKVGQIQYTLDNYGYAPEFTIKNKTGELIFEGYVSLVLRKENEDYFDIPGTDMRLFVRLFPDFVMTGTGPSTRSEELNNPVLGLRLTKGIETVRGKLLKMGKTVEIGDIQVAAGELRPWAHFGAARDMGQPVLFASIIIMTGGLLLRFYYYEKWLRVTLDNTRVEVAGYSRYFPALFKGEVERIADELSEIYGKK